MEFTSSPVNSIGAELELQLLDVNSLDLVDGILPLLDVCPDTTYVKPEYIQFTVEIASKVCASLSELESHLLSQVVMLEQAARKLGMRLASTGTHPFCSRLGLVTPSPRYYRVKQDTGYVGHSQITYAIHVHVGVASGDEAIVLMQRLRPYLPALLALSANSPYWQGHDTGFSSYRQRVLMAAHAFGTPPQFSSWREFEQLVETSQRAHIFDHYTDMHWDLRPRPDFGTLEIRVMDAQPTVAESMALTSLIHSLIEYLRASDGEDMLQPLPLWLEFENHYRASHQGLNARCVIDEDGNTSPMREIVRELLKRVTPYARDLGEEEYLAGVYRLLREGGNSALQQRLRARHGSLYAVVEHMADRLSEEAWHYAERHYPDLPGRPDDRPAELRPR